jgi:predicted nucleic acid-binding protein
MTAFFDTAVIMYAAGKPHPLRGPCRQLIEAVVDQGLDGVTSAEVIQEILHRFSTGDRRSVGAAMAESALDVFAPVLPVTEGVMREMPSLFLQYPALTARDLIHLAVCRVHGIDLIISPDRGFDGIEGITRIDPADAPGRLLPTER